MLLMCLMAFALSLGLLQVVLLVTCGNGVAARARGDLTISCGGSERARGVSPAGLYVWSCTLSWKFTLGECGLGIMWDVSGCG